MMKTAAGSVAGGLRSVAPSLVHPSEQDVARLASFLLRAQGRTLVLTGAGLSTESGIPDYRSPNGSYSKGHKPVTHQEFVSSEDVRQRYWARSIFGIEFFSQAKPNRAHQVLTELKTKKLVSDIITQNVDRLHRDSGFPAKNILELHGHGEGVKCLKCNEEFHRLDYTSDLMLINEEFLNDLRRNEEAKGRTREDEITPDGDADVGDLKTEFSEFFVLPCYNCGGVLMPTIVFFGGSIPIEVKQKAEQLVRENDQILVLGTSLQTLSSLRIVRDMHDKMTHRTERQPHLGEVGIINLGATRGDNLATWKAECSLSEIFSALSQRLPSFGL